MEKNSDVEKTIDLFIQKVKYKVPAITQIMYEYNESIQSYLIWHNLVPKEEEKYSKELGALICDYLFANDVYDFSFAYNPEKFPKTSIYQI